MSGRKIACLIFLFAEFSALFAQNDVPFRGWKQAETKHFRFIFEAASRAQTEAYAKYADEAWNKIAKVYALPQDKTDVFVTARTNTVNAFTFYVPPEIMMFTTPVTISDFGFRDNWQKLFFTHELVHIANVQFEDKSYVPSKIFGSYMNSFDLSSVPGWALEGLTTVLETELTDGGRGRSPYFELMYKAPTLDNAFISYDEIGMEREPPHGQSYVMGYLIMRSIADRWGLSALADIERNRSFCGSWEDSVRLVTGESAEDIYKDVCIALAKKYASERSIPEGIIISPRTVNTYFYKPAIVNDDGTIIAIRSSATAETAVVKFDPSAIYGSGFFEDAHPEKDLNTVRQETVLFTGDFSDAMAVTASADGTVYASLAIQRSDRMPGSEKEYALFKWTKETGLVRLTKNTSLIEPSVSRDGKVLVAVEQHGLQMRLVRVSVDSGKITPLLENSEKSFIQPAVNAAGNAVAFLALDGHRAAVAFADGNDAHEDESYTVVANGTGAIVDPSYPSWNSDGTLTYTCNDRGRLEVYEVRENSSNNEDRFVSRPVVSDPIAALWAYKTERGIYYESYASTGYVLKMKPASEWGVVPATDGPSPAGSIISFGAYENDYPTFKPYDIPSEKETVNQGKAKKRQHANKDKNTPIAVRGKVVAHRTEKNSALAKESNEVQTTLQNEKTYIPVPTPILHIPFVVAASTGSDNSTYNWGVGYSAFFLLPKLQFNIGVITADVVYYPSLTNFQSQVSGFIPVGSTEIDFILSHSFSNILSVDETYQFTESNYGVLGFTFPFLHRIQHLNEIDISMIASADFNVTRKSDTVIAVTDTIPFNVLLDGLGGFDFVISKECKRDSVFTFDATALALATCAPYESEAYVGFEGEAGITYGSDSAKTELNICSRYTDFPYEIVPVQSRAHLSDALLNCSWPGRAVVRLGRIIPSFLGQGINGECFAEKLFSFGKNSVDYETPDSGLLYNMTFDSTVTCGFELNATQGRQKIAGGYTCTFDYETLTYTTGNFYFRMKMNWIRR